MRRSLPWLVSQQQQRRAFSTSSKQVIVCALSGGVDSSVAAQLLFNNEQQPESHADKKKNVVVTAIHMSNWNKYEDDSLSCTSDTDWKDAQSVAQHVGLPIQRLSFETAYWNQVFEPYLQEIQRGRMGNPDVDCNVHVKFGALRDYIQQRYGGEAMLATGHYARVWNRRRHLSSTSIEMPESLQQAMDEIDVQVVNWIMQDRQDPQSQHSVLYAAADESKDQSYFLAKCPSEAFSNVLFPLGELLKKTNNHGNYNDNSHVPSVRSLAQDFGLPTAKRRESMGICFVGKRRSFQDFLESYLEEPTKDLELVHVETMDVIARLPKRHACLYTIGQGAKLGGTTERLFVSDVQVDTNRVIVCPGTHHPSLYTDTIYIHQLETWKPLLHLLHQGESFEMSCRIRHLQPLMRGRICFRDGLYRIDLERPVRGVTPGQFVALYSGVVCLGGGSIERRGPTYYELNQPLSQVYAASHNDLSVSVATT